MATRRIFEVLCDDCDEHGLTDVPAPFRHTLALDGGPVKQLDFCPRDEIAFVDYIVKLYERGVVVEEPAPAEKKPVRKDVPKQASTEDQPPEPVPAPPQNAPAAPVSKPRPSKQKPSKAAKEDEAKVQRLIWCPEPHTSKRGKGMFIDYVGRHTHAPNCHDGKQPWEIAWEDPHGHFKAFCTAHEPCRLGSPRGYGFTTKQGLRQHLQARELPISDADGQPPGKEADS